LVSDNKQDTIQLLRDFIGHGQYGDQQRLPPERDLTVKLGVSRPLLRKALAVLESEGLVWRHVGRGTFVGPRPSNRTKDNFIVVDFTNPAEIMEARLVLEPKIAAIAALRASPDDIVRMENALEQSLLALTPVDFETWDGILHAAIIKSAGNTLLISFSDVLTSLRHDKIWGQLKEASWSRKRQDLYCRQHRMLIEAISERNAVKAQKTMQKHLEDVQRNMLGSL